MSKVKFDDGEFEIAIATYNRSQFVKFWLEKCYTAACERNISVSVYDSSTNDETLMYIQQFNESVEKRIEYVRIDSETIIGYKPMYPILQSKSKYVWVSGDSRYHDFNEMDTKVFPFIKKGLDFVLLQTTNNAENSGKIYTDLGEFLHECFISSTCIGLSIYKTEIFDDLKHNEKLMEHYDDLFKDNYGFAWLGYFYNEFARGSRKAAFAKVETYNILSKQKVQTWAKRFYGCWLEDLCQIIDNIPTSYTGKENVPKETWKIMKLDNHHYSYNSRKTGDLNAESYARYKQNGMLSRVVDNEDRIRFYATASIEQVERKYKLYCIITFTFRFLKKIKGLIREYVFVRCI